MGGHSNRPQFLEKCGNFRFLKKVFLILHWSDVTDLLMYHLDPFSPQQSSAQGTCLALEATRPFDANVRHRTNAIHILKS